MRRNPDSGLKLEASRLARKDSLVGPWRQLRPSLVFASPFSSFTSLQRRAFSGSNLEDEDEVEVSPFSPMDCVTLRCPEGFTRVASSTVTGTKSPLALPPHFRSRALFVRKTSTHDNFSSNGSVKKHLVCWNSHRVHLFFNSFPFASWPWPPWLVLRCLENTTDQISADPRDCNRPFGVAGAVY